MDNLQLRQRIVRSMIRVSERTANMRKPEKFEYRKHMTAAFMDWSSALRLTGPEARAGQNSRTKWTPSWTCCALS